MNVYLLYLVIYHSFLGQQAAGGNGNLVHVQQGEAHTGVPAVWLDPPHQLIREFGLIRHIIRKAGYNHLSCSSGSFSA